MSENSSVAPEVVPEFGKVRKFLFPVHSFEVKKALPMGMMFFFILFNYTCLRNLKDALVVTAPNSGAEVLPFLKGWLVMPCAVLFTFLYAKGSDAMSCEKLFYVTMGIFIAFFGIFGFVIYPNLNILHPAAKTVAEWQNAHKTWAWPLAAVGNWSFALFYMMAELWGSVALSLLFWQFANQICKTSEAKRFYAFFGLLAQFSLLLAGELADAFAKTESQSKSVFWIIGIVVASGLLVMCIYRWIYVYVLTDKKLYDKPELPGAKKKKTKMGFWQSMKIMVTSPYLGLIAALVICYGISVNLMEGLWKGQAHTIYSDKNQFNAFMGRYSRYTGIVSIFVMIVGGNILRKFSWFTAAVITPVLTLITGSLFFAFVIWKDSFADSLASFADTLTRVLKPEEAIVITPVIAAVLLGEIILILAKSTKYALFDLTKEMAYIPLDEEMKVKGKVVVDVVGGRLGKASGAWIQLGLLTIFSKIWGTKARLIQIAPCLFGIFVVSCIVWTLAVNTLSKKITAVTAQPPATATS
ncbi:MAG: NTP/NDP exchange transporter [Puniceicoccales bacterium]|jgi:AAA family ATP:ADP antiporter|nr:NTP/NDP exchange transporter [Puniceicoccales bacterium]